MHNQPTPPMSEAQVTIRELKMNGDTAIRIAACLKKHEPEIWEVLREELKQSMREVEVTDSTEQSTADPYYTDPATWPEWARFRVANPDRREFWSSERPLIHDSPSTPYWLFGVGKTTECHDRRLIYADWKESMVERSMAI